MYEERCKTAVGKSDAYFFFIHGNDGACDQREWDGKWDRERCRGADAGRGINARRTGAESVGRGICNSGGL